MESGIDPGQDYYTQDYYNYDHGSVGFCRFVLTHQFIRYHCYEKKVHDLCL